MKLGILLVVFGVAVNLFADSEEPADLTKLKSAYEQAVDRELEPIDTAFEREVTKLRDALTQSGKLDEALVVDAYLKFLVEENGDPVETAGVAQLRRLIEIRDRAVGNATHDLDERYRQELSALQTRYSRQNRLQDAVAVANELKNIEASERSSGNTPGLPIMASDKARVIEEHSTAYKGNRYSLILKGMQFEEARNYCELLGGQLVVIESEAELEFLLRKFQKEGVSRGLDQAEIWIGLTDQEKEGEFKWVDGTELGDYTYWRGGEPANLGDEDGVGVRPDKFLWVDMQLTRVRRAICEWPEWPPDVSARISEEDLRDVLHGGS